MPYTRSVFSFIETRLFTRLVQEYFSEEKYSHLQLELVENPEAGPVIPGSERGYFKPQGFRQFLAVGSSS